MRRAQRELKDSYRQKLERNLQVNDMREVWTAMKTITGCKTGGAALERSIERANEFNTFFNRFDSTSEIMCGPRVVGGAREHLERQQAWSSPVSAEDICGCIAQWLGHSPQSQGHQRPLGCPQAGPAYQCLGTESNSPGPLAFPAKAA